VVYSFIVCSGSIEPLVFWQTAELSDSELPASILRAVCQKANDSLKTNTELIQLHDSFEQEGRVLWVLICNSSNTCPKALGGNINMCSTNQNGQYCYELPSFCVLGKKDNGGHPVLKSQQTLKYEQQAENKPMRNSGRG